MAIQTSTLTSNLSAAQSIIVAEMLYSAEFAAPLQHLIRNLKLDTGAKQKNVPQMGQMTASALTEGVDMVDEQNTITDFVALTTSEIGLKVILTDKLLRQQDADLFRACGKTMGEAVARKVDKDIIALFAGLNGGTSLGVDNALLTLASATACAAWAAAQPAPKPIYFVHHPNALAELARQAAGVGSLPHSGVFGGLNSATQKILENFYQLTINGVPFLADGNIGKTTGDSGIGAVFSKDSMCYIHSLLPTSETERDASLRAAELVMVSDYGVFELETGHGAPCTYEIGNLSTTST